MNIFVAILILIGFFVFRFGLPIVITMGVGMMQQRRQEDIF